MSESKISKMLKGKALISARSARLASPADRPGPRPRQHPAGVIRPRPACAVQGEEPVDLGGTAAIFVSQHQPSAATRALVAVGGGVSAALVVPTAVGAISFCDGLGAARGSGGLWTQLVPERCVYEIGTGRGPVDAEAEGAEAEVTTDNR